MVELGQILEKLTGWFETAEQDEQEISGHTQDLGIADVGDLMNLNAVRQETNLPAEVINPLQNSEFDLENLSGVHFSRSDRIC